MAEAENVKPHDAIYIDGLMGPKPHHAAFYLDVSTEHIAGRKFYFHHTEPRTMPEPTSRNRYIQPLGYDTKFCFRLDFTALQAQELGALLFAIALNQEMRHKIGYGKPLGLGSVYLEPVKLTLIDYAARYTSPGRCKTDLQNEAMWDAIYTHMDSFEQRYLARPAWDDLQRIWHWESDPEVDVTYRYPSYAWFHTPGNSSIRLDEIP